MITRKQIERAIKERYNVTVEVGGNWNGLEGCYYISFDDKYQQVMINSLNQYTLEQWVSEFEYKETIK